MTTPLELVKTALAWAAELGADCCVAAGGAVLLALSLARFRRTLDTMA